MFSADRGALMWDSTAVHNGFLLEFMPAAPDGYVKAYLYGLVYAHNPDCLDGMSVAQMAKELGMEEGEIRAAFRYWERLRLVERIQDNPPAYRYLSVRQALSGREAVPGDDGYMEFAQALYAIFGDRRTPSGSDSVLCYEWVEQLGLPREVVLMLVQHLISTRGVNFSFKEGQKLAVELKNQGVNGIEAAEQLFSRSEAAWKGAGKVLRRMGKYRYPSVDETDLYLKWTVEWGFTPKAIEQACGEMTKGDPSFAYLDGILKGLRERGGAGDVKRQLETEKREAAKIKEMLKAYGASTALSDTVKAVYKDMLGYAPHEVVLLAAGVVGKRKSKSLDEVTELLRNWSAKGIKDEASARAHIESVKEQDRQLRRVTEAAGREEPPTAAGREYMRKWRENMGFSMDVILVCAEAAKGTDMPLRFMDKVLASWKKAGVGTADEARAARAERENAGEKKKAKTVPEQRYKQRKYDPAIYVELTPEEIEEAHKYDA